MTNTRESIHTERGLSTSPTWDDESFPTDADREFMSHVRKVLGDAASDAIEVQDDGKGYDSIHAMESLLYEVLYYNAFKRPERWDYDVRFVNALLTGVNTGGISLTGIESVNALRHLISCGILTQVVEYYVHTGEYLELADFYREGNGEFSDPRGRLNYQLNHEMRVRTLRLYRYDVTKVEEHLNLPLDMRVQFSGFWDEFNEDDDFSFDHMGTVVDDFMEQRRATVSAS